MYDQLPFTEIWACDFEYVAGPGELPDPVCMVARELRTGRLVRLWRGEFPSQPPFRIDGRAMLVAYAAAAELGCFLQLGWPMPARILDLYVEFSALTNGLERPNGRGLLAALAHFRIAGISKEEKQTTRELVIAGGPWSPAERAEILDYCQGDVDVLGPLLQAMEPIICCKPTGLGQAFFRGRYTAAVAHMEYVGSPIDTDTLYRIRRHWSGIKLGLIEGIDQDYGVYDGTTFKLDRFSAWLAQHEIPWPSTETGRPKTDQDTFADMSKVYPQLSPLKELRHALSDLRLEQLAVGRDGRNRTGLMPFGAATGRNTPGSTRFIFGPSVWIRSLLKPAPGQALAYLDWSSQEFVIAAALSHDARMLEAAESGDPYIAFAVMAGLAPADATRETHGTVRDQCKQCVLGANYGMGPATLAYRIGGSRVLAEHLLRLLESTFPRYWTWAQAVQDQAALTGRLQTCFGWPMNIYHGTRATTIRNWPMQAHGAEMLRVACCYATEAGVRVCAPVHDALLIEAPSTAINEAVDQASSIMRRAATYVLEEVAVNTDAKVIRWPDRYMDRRGEAMWNRVTGLLDDLDARSA